MYKHITLSSLAVVAAFALVQGCGEEPRSSTSSDDPSPWDADCERMCERVGAVQAERGCADAATLDECVASCGAFDVFPDTSACEPGVQMAIDQTVLCAEDAPTCEAIFDCEFVLSDAIDQGAAACGEPGGGGSGGGIEPPPPDPCDFDCSTCPAEDRADCELSYPQCATLPSPDRELCCDGLTAVWSQVCIGG